MQPFSWSSLFQPKMNKIVPLFTIIFWGLRSKAQRILEYVSSDRMYPTKNSHLKAQIVGCIWKSFRFGIALWCYQPTKATFDLQTTFVLILNDSVVGQPHFCYGRNTTANEWMFVHERITRYHLPSWVMQMEPQPMPTLRASTPASMRFLAWAAVTTKERQPCKEVMTTLCNGRSHSFKKSSPFPPTTWSSEYFCLM